MWGWHELGFLFLAVLAFNLLYQFVEIFRILMTTLSGGCARVFLQNSPPSTKIALLVTAHPDDEAMFFAPALRHIGRMVETDNAMGGLSSLHWLCLSTGNAEGLGDLRVKELQKSAQFFGVPQSHVVRIHSSCSDPPRFN